MTTIVVIEIRLHVNQLAQSVLKIGSALAERVGQREVGGSAALADHAWQLLQLVIEGPGQCWMARSFAFLYKRV